MNSSWVRRRSIGLHAGVIEGRADVVGLEKLGHRFGVVAADAINDRRLIAVALQYFQHLTAGVDARYNAIDQVGPVESADQQFGIMQLQLLGDVVAHSLRCGGGVGVKTGFGKMLFEFRQTAILRAKIMAPMADAMGLVDGESMNLDLLGQLQEMRHEQAFRRDEEQLIAAGEELRFGVMHRVGGHAAVKRACRIAALAQAVDLIFHQRDQRRNHNVGTLGHGRGNLVAQRLAAAGGHNDQRVAVIQFSADRLLLQRPQLIVSPIAPQGIEDGTIRRLCC